MLSLDMNRAIFRNSFKLFVFNGKSPLINPEKLSSVWLNITAVAEVSQISGFLLETSNFGVAEPFSANFRGCLMEDMGSGKCHFFLFLSLIC